MTPSLLAAYLDRLETELRRRGVTGRRVLEEARDHLVDAIRSGMARGLSTEAAEREAILNFGEPEAIAAAFADRSTRMNNRLLGLLDRFLGTRRRSEADTGHYHDVGGPAALHCAMRLKRPWRKRFLRMSAPERERFIAAMRERGEDVTPFEADPQQRLVQFLRDFSRRRFGSAETLESLTVLEEMADPARRGGKYLASFSGGTKMIWTVALAPDGSVSFDGTRAHA